MRDIISVKLDIVYPINKQLNKLFHESYFFIVFFFFFLFFEIVKSKLIISLFETVRLSVSISSKNLYNSLKSIKDIFFSSSYVITLYNKCYQSYCTTTV